MLRLRHLASSAALLLAASGPLHVPANVEEVPGPTVLPSAYPQELVVVTRTSATTRFQTIEGEFAGIEHDLVTLFADELGVPVRFIEAETEAEVLNRLSRGEAHIGAASLVASRRADAPLLFGPGYMDVRQVLVHRRDASGARSLRALDTKRVIVSAQSRGAELLDHALAQGPSLNVGIVDAGQPEAVPEKVAAGEADFGITTSHVFDLVRAARPELRTAFTLGKTEKLAWAFPLNADPTLLKQARKFFRRIAADGTLARLVDRYYGHVNRLPALEVDAFLEQCETTLPSYRPHLLEAERATGLDWRLIAALGYQESRWNPKATSPTGVQGFMMLTQSTQQRMGVRINHAAHANIIAGARYLAMLRDRLPARIAEPDRTWFALAAYNQGPGHLEDARVLAQKLGMNPDVWVDVRRALPLLADPAYYEELPHGYARGGEAMALTENVRAFYKILVQIAPPMRELSQPGAPYLTDEAPSPTDDDISKEPVRQDEVLLPDPILI
jgi:membrane-bound lytic murein transglycosylase F